MADDNLKDFTMSWIMFGLLFFGMLSFAVMFFANNNPEGLGDSSTKFTDAQAAVQSKLVSINSSADTLLNISSQSDPQVSDLGSRDSVATSYGLTGVSKGFWESSKVFISWIFEGTTGKMLLAVFTGMIGLLFVYFITKWIRVGF